MFKPNNHNPALRDALLSSQKGRDLAHEAKAAAREEYIRVIEAKRQEIGKRVRALKDLAHATFMGDQIPVMTDGKGRKLVHPRPDVFFNSKDNIREIGRRGGQDYDRAVMALKFAYNDFYVNGRLGHSYREAIEAILPPEFDKRKEDLRAVELDIQEVEISADQMTELREEVAATAQLHTDIESSDGITRYEQQ